MSTAASRSLRLAVGAGVCLVGASCTNPAATSTAGRDTTGAATTTTGGLGAFATATPGAPGCQPVSPIIGNEVMGTIDGGTVFGLLFVEPPVTAGDEVKIVWRITGTGSLRVDARRGDERAVLTFGPELHGSSTWERPGVEWGTGWIFPSAGCWDVRLRGDDATGHVWLHVDP